MTRYSHTAAALYLYLLLVMVSARTSIRRRDVAQQRTASEFLQVHQDYESPDVEPRIVGGVEASYGQFPWFSSSSGNILCGASLIHKQFLLSAAHCYEAFLPGSRVYIGAYELGSGNVTRTVADAVLHPEYDNEPLVNDYLLLLLDAPVETIIPIELNTDDTIPADGDTVMSMGFGHTSQDGEVAMTLRYVDLTTVSHLTCATAYLLIQPITESNMLCAVNDGKDTCNGDSGGPLISADGKQVGIVSAGQGCARPNIPSVYARVSGGMSFINAGICSLATVDRPDSCPGDQTVPNGTNWTDYDYEQCEDFGIQTGNGSVMVNGTKIYGEATPITGCIAIDMELWTGEAWSTGDSDDPLRPCIGQAGMVGWWASWASDVNFPGTTRVMITEAEGDSFYLKVCWDD